MKKMLVLLVLLSSFFSFSTSYNQIDREELEKVNHLENGVAMQFVIPKDIHLSDPDRIYPFLCQAANQFQVNILRSNIHYQSDDQVEILKYVFLTGDTHFFDVFRLKSGRLLTPEDTQQANSFMCTTSTGDPTQIGVVKDFGGNNLITIKSLKNSYEQFPVDGPYFAEAPNREVFHAFVNCFANKVNQYYKDQLTEPFLYGDFVKTSTSGGTATGGAVVGSPIGYLSYINYLVYLVILILLIYYIFNESKRIGIIKMHGISNLYLWFIIAGKLITILFGITTLITLLAALCIKDTCIQFVISILINQLKAYGIMLALSLVAYLYISRIKVVNALKNRKDTNGIFALNTLLKAGCSVLLVLTCLTLWNQISVIHAKQQTLKNWECSKDYGVFYPLYIRDEERKINDGAGPRADIEDELYLLLNRMGALLINTHMYDQQELLLNKDWDGILSISVNPNYLREFPVYDLQQQPVQVSEDNSDWILLVPEKYHDREEEILSFFKKDRTGGKNSEGVYQEGVYQHEERCKRVVPDRVRNQQLKIIWLANEQQIFSFNPNVFPQENNMIIDPIIRVVTEQNSVVTDRSSILGGGATDPLKMKLIDRDTLKTYQTLVPELKELRLDDNLKYLVTVDQFILQEIYHLQEAMNQFLLISLGLLAGLLFLVVQNLVIFFNKHQYRFIVRRLFGAGFFKTYKEYFWLFSAAWVLQILICFIVRWRINVGMMPALGMIPKTIDASLIFTAAGLIAFELAASIIALGVIERKNKTRVLKGGA